ncbi:hypothetical protein [Kribbella capetownensis]|uniref:hypothetical protein n=1 Tax=Kribbella capetownensis TaxID=1572659 RepID=UPI0013F40799|nr:hypothetical protein [Kribbella capetownensis]
MSATACARPVSPPYAPRPAGRCSLPSNPPTGNPRVPPYDALLDATEQAPNRGSVGR